MSDNDTTMDSAIFDMPAGEGLDALLDRLLASLSLSEPEDRDPSAPTMHVGVHGDWDEQKKRVVELLCKVMETIGVKVYCDCGADGCSGTETVAQLKREDTAVTALATGEDGQ